MFSHTYCWCQSWFQKKSSHVEVEHHGEAGGCFMMNFLRENTHKQSHTFESYSNWQLHSTIDIHWPLSNTSTQANYTSLDNNHDNSASSVSPTRKPYKPCMLKLSPWSNKSKVKPFEPATIGCFYWLFSLILRLAFPATIPHLNNERSFQISNCFIYTCFSLKTKSQIQLTCQHIDDMQLEIRFVGVLLVSCQTKQKGSLGSGWMSDKSLSVAKSADGNT